ncbi:MAG: carboxylesterase/lipase family protein, partial [Gemmatimonadota bacterium]
MVAAALAGLGVSLVLTACQARVETDGPPIARAGGERIQGEWLEAGMAVFRGVPYAAAPTGDLRWRPPGPPDARRGLQSATEFGAACPQIDRLAAFIGNIAAAFEAGEDVVPILAATDEDCLTLNIWTPEFEDGADLPVMVWIHGGSNNAGRGSQGEYDGVRLAARGVVLVSINYRLGPLGFFAHPALSAESPGGASGNYGLMDQVAALQWVKDNIAEFGGDPDRVTIFGESAGSTDIILLMTAPAAEGLFQRAIGQSGAPMVGLTPRSTGEAAGVRLVRKLGFDNPDSETAIAELRVMDAGALVRAIDDVDGTYSVRAVLDGLLLTRDTDDVFADGDEAAVPLLIGSNQNEFATLPYYLPAIERTVEGYEKWVASTRGRTAGRVLELYPAAEDAGVTSALVSQVTDFVFTCATRTAARRHSAAGNATYRYFFTRVSPGPGGDALGAYHGMEIGYVFNNRYDWIPADEADLRLDEAMAGAWVRFAATGDPNGDGLAAWPEYDAETDAYMEFG